MEAAIWWTDYGSLERASSFRYKGSLGLPNQSECDKVVAGTMAGTHAWQRSRLVVYERYGSSLLTDISYPGGGAAYSNCQLSSPGSVRAYSVLVGSNAGLDINMYEIFLQNPQYCVSYCSFTLRVQWLVGTND